MGTRQNRLIEAVLTCTHNICFEQKYENSQKNSIENCHFYSCEKSLYIAWACFRNDMQRCSVEYLPSKNVLIKFCWVLSTMLRQNKTNTVILTCATADFKVSENARFKKNCLKNLLYEKFKMFGVFRWPH